MTLHRVSPEEYAKRRRSEIRTIDHFVIHFSNKMNVKCKNDEGFTMSRSDGQQVSNVDIKIDVYDLRVGDEVCICGVRGVISEIEIIRKGLLENAPERLDVTPKGILFTLFRNAGSLAKCVQYAERYGEIGRTDMMKANLVEARGELGDVITQCRILAEVYDWNYQQVVEDGQDRFEVLCRELHNKQV